MTFFTRYPHVKKLIAHYANAQSELDVLKQLEFGVKTSAEADHFGRFIWRMADLMKKDAAAGVHVMGRLDNSDMLPDVYNEISDLMFECGFEPVWERICEEA